LKIYDRNEPINIGKLLADHGARPRRSRAPFVVRDYYNGPLAYESPLSGRWIDSRADRHKEMKAHDVREVDPSEKPKGGWNNPEWAKKRGFKVEE
jgi:hypothetical protein